MRASLALLALIAALAPAGAHALAANASHPARDAARRLITMSQVRPVEITPQSVTVDTNGRGDVIVVLGELTIPRPTRFRLSATGLTRLRHLIARSGVAHLHLDAPFTTRAEMYTITVAGNTVRVAQGHLPRRLRPLIALLHALISRYT